MSTEFIPTSHQQSEDQLNKQLYLKLKVEQSGTDGTVGTAEIVSSFKNFNPRQM